MNEEIREAVRDQDQEMIPEADLNREIDIEEQRDPQVNQEVDQETNLDILRMVISKI
jgi:hypothetical protein